MSPWIHNKHDRCSKGNINDDCTCHTFSQLIEDRVLCHGTFIPRGASSFFRGAFTSHEANSRRVGLCKCLCCRYLDWNYICRTSSSIRNVMGGNCNWFPPPIYWLNY